MNFFLIVILFCSISICQAQSKFDEFFISKTLRLDYIHSGNATSEHIFFQDLKQLDFWAGSKVNLLDTFNYGEHLLIVYDSISNNIIYSRGYCSLFQEWQTTAEAKKMEKAFNGTVLLPFPKNTVRVEIHSRDKKLQFHKISETWVNPNSYFINKEKINNYPVFKIVESGDPSVKVDLVIVPDGYTADEMEKFRKDASRFTKKLFELAPFSTNKNNFNVSAIEAPSKESGTDIPGKNIWKNTIINTNFYTFDSERYLTTSDVIAMNNVASAAPYDQIFVLVNSKKYGGGGIFNLYSVSSSDDPLAEYVFLHEFGHAFGGLADEYYTSSTSYEDFLPKTIEPWQPNVTSMADFSKKWIAMINKKTPVPTPDDKKYYNSVGVFEGAAYESKGMYRPYFDCTMKTLMGSDGFCPVCRKSIQSIIDFYCK